MDKPRVPPVFPLNSVSPQMQGVGPIRTEAHFASVEIGSQRAKLILKFVWRDNLDENGGGSKPDAVERIPDGLRPSYALGCARRLWSMPGSLGGFGGLGLGLALAAMKATSASRTLVASGPRRLCAARPGVGAASCLPPILTKIASRFCGLRCCAPFPKPRRTQVT
jgi:hypothetical protein